MAAFSGQNRGVWGVSSLGDQGLEHLKCGACMLLCNIYVEGEIERQRERERERERKRERLFEGSSGP